MSTKRKRDFSKDRRTCEAATPGPYQITPCKCDQPACNQVFISITHSDGRLDPEDAAFYSEAREGWPDALDEIDRLRKLIREFQAAIDDGDITTYANVPYGQGVLEEIMREVNADATQETGD